jgi:Ca2+-binding RTX toxin-like protein
VTGPFTANATIRFVVSGGDNDGGNVEIENVAITFSGQDTLNGGPGNDTYSIALGDGDDTINEGDNEGSADRILIQTAGAALVGLNAFDNDGDTEDGELVIQFNGQTVTVNGHFNGPNEERGVELINFGGATFEGFALGTEDYAVSRLDPANRDDGDVDLTDFVTNNFVVGENGTSDLIIGSGEIDLIFGGTGNDTLNGADSDDLLVGGEGNDELNGDVGNDTLVGGANTDELNGGDDDDTLVGGDGNDVLNGGLGNDTYVFGLTDDADQINEGADAGSQDRIMIGAPGNVLTGLNAFDNDGDPSDGELVIQFNGQTVTVNSHFNGGNAQTGVELINFNGSTFEGYAFGVENYAISRLDPVNRAAGDVDLSASSTNNFVVGEDGTGDLITGGTDKDLVFGGSGNDTLVGNTGDDLLVGGTGTDLLVGGAGLDVLVGAADSDTLDGGSADDILNGGDGNDTVIGGAGNDTINVSLGDDLIVYDTVGFGADIVNGFDALGGSQDRIDVRGLGIDLGNFGTMVTITDLGSDTMVTFGGGSVRLNGVTGTGTNAITSDDFILSTVGNLITGGPTGQTHNGLATRDTINALGGGDLVNGNGGDDTIVGGLGDDTVNGNDGNDTIIWNANPPPPPATNVTDGRDLVNGGTEAGLGDTFVVNGNATSETYNIYTRAAWIALGGGNTTTNPAAEIVVARNGLGNANIIAELVEIEEIRLNGVDPSGASGAVGGDTFNIVGNFAGTSLRPNTITIVGDVGADKVNLSGMTGTNVVFQSNGGNDAVVDAASVSEKAPAGSIVYSPSTGAKSAGAGSYSLSGSDAHLFSIDSKTGAVKFLATPDFENPNDRNGDNVYDLTVHENGGSVSHAVAISVTDVAGAKLKGTGKNDKINGTSKNASTDEDDVINGKKGNDKIQGLAGDDNIKGGAGKDRLDGGVDDDVLNGGAGKDTYIFADGYGQDVVKGYKAGEDSFDLSGTGVGSFKELKGLMSKDGGSTVIDFANGDTLTILNTSIKKLNASDFDFA